MAVSLMCDALLGRCGGLIFLCENRLNASDFSTKRAELARLFELPARLLETEVKDLLAKFALASAKFVESEFADFIELHTRWLA